MLSLNVINAPRSSYFQLQSGFAVLLTVFCLNLACCGADWPQYRGPTHDGVSTDRINKQWTGSVTNALWRVFLGNGITSFAVSGGLALTQVHRDVNGADTEVCVALNTSDGTEAWATPVDDIVSYWGGGVGSTDDGPRSTPTLDNGSVYVMSSYLKLLRLNAINGSVVWSNNLMVTYGSGEIPWQNAASLLVENGLIFLNANAPTSSLMALRTTDGSLAWRTQDEVLSHSTPVLTTIDGVHQVVFATKSNLVSLNPTTGGLLWKVQYPFRVGDTLAVSPVIHSNIVFISGYYTAASFATRVSLSNSTWVTTPLWTNSSLRSWWSTPVAYQGHLFGQFNPDNQYTALRCIELATGAEKWVEYFFGRGSVLLVDDHLLAITETGFLVLATPNTNAYTEVARLLAIPDYHSDTNKCWNAPAVCDGKVYVRSTAYAAAFDLSVPETPYLKLDPPWLSPGKLLGLTIRTTNGTPIGSNRLTGMEVKTSADPAMPLALWTKLTNSLSLTNGIVSVTNVDASAPRRFFIVSEPK